MIWNIVYAPNGDKFSLPKGENVIYIPETNKKITCSDNIEEKILRANLNPSPTVLDFLSIAKSAYVADQLISRSLYGYLSWSRSIKLHIPVSSEKKWNSVKEQIEETLSFLSGDKWEILFRKGGQKFDTKRNYKNKREITDVNIVSLFSGGLDSMIGAIDLLEKGKNIELVSHHKSGGPELKAQGILCDKLVKKYPKSKIGHFDFLVQAKSIDKNTPKEESSRARSIIFIALGLIVANSISDNCDLYIPENGLISLNVPLLSSRLGSLSTKTTHPFFISQLQEILKKVGIKNKIVNPYSFKTKGDMIVESNKPLIKQLYSYSISCAHPNINRYSKKGVKSIAHCGYCTPCIIRRAALNKAKISGESYYVDFKKEEMDNYKDRSRDYRAFKLGLQKQKKSKSKQIFDILASGPLPGKEDDIINYVKVFNNGLNEIAKIL